VKYIGWVIAVFLALFLQSRLSFFDVKPDLTALLAYYAGIRYGERRGLVIGVLIGAIEDSVSSAIIGPNLLAKGLIGFFASFFVSGGIFMWTPVLGAMAIGMLTFVDNSVVFLLRSFFQGMPAMPTTALYIAAIQSLLSAPAGIFIRPRHAD
jgi:rod shape-determining protein MreD